MKQKTLSSSLFLLSIFCVTFLLHLSSCKEEDAEELMDPIPSQVPPEIKNSFIDPRDSNNYTYVDIGGQVWMAENLRYLPIVIGSNSASDSIALYYVYGYQGNSVEEAKATNNYKNYGVLYNFSAAIQGGVSDPEIPGRIKGVCPTGWHLPSDKEWTLLTDYLGGRALAGGKLKARGTTFWKSPNTGATNETGFTGLPGGFRSTDGNFYDLRENGFWWSSTANGNNLAWFRNMYYQYGDVYRIDFPKNAAFCVRCIQD